MHFVDLYSGAGGLSHGMITADFTPIAAFDQWRAAVKTYRANFTHPVYRADLSKVPAMVRRIEHLAPDLIAGGPPCQDFSPAGRRVEKGRATLTTCFAEIVAAVRPEWVLMENVPQAHRSRAYRRSRGLLQRAGYGLTEIVLDASLCGVPQRRLRFFCIGCLGEADGFLEPGLRAQMATRPMTVRDHVGMLFGVEHYYRHPRNYDRQGVFSIDQPAPTVRGVNRPVAPGYRRHPKDSADPRLVRALTFRERSLVQTFPLDWVWKGSRGDIEQMIGNAVPPKLAAFVGRAILAYATSQSSRLAA